MNKLLYYGEVYGNLNLEYIFKKFNINEVQYANIIYYWDTKDLLYTTLKNRYNENYSRYNEIEWTLFRLTYNI